MARSSRTSYRAGHAEGDPARRVRRPRGDGRRDRAADHRRRLPGPAGTGRRRRPQALLDAGMGWADTPREVAASVRRGVHDADEHGGHRGDAPTATTACSPGCARASVWADMSTIAPDASVALAEEVARDGRVFLDAPVSGSPATLAAGQMSVMVGGDRAAFDHVEPVLHAIGPKVTYIGPNGHAILTKVAINLALVVVGDGVRGGRRAGGEGRRRAGGRRRRGAQERDRLAGDRLPRAAARRRRRGATPTSSSSRRTWCWRRSSAAGSAMTVPLRARRPARCSTRCAQPRAGRPRLPRQRPRGVSPPREGRE